MATAIATNFRFDAARHEYWLGSERLPSVTEVMAAVGIIEVEWVSAKALSRGSAVHAGAHLMDIEELDVAELLAKYEIHPDLHGYLRGWARFKYEQGVRVLDSEVARFHPTYRFAGTRDKRACWLGKVYKLDIKTVGQIGAPGPKWAAEQTAAYDLLDPSTDKMHQDHRASIVLYPDGSWKTEFHRDYNDATYFLSYLSTYRRLIHHGKITGRSNQ